MYRLNYYAGDEKDALEFEIEKTGITNVPDMEIRAGTVSEMQLEKWNGVAFADVNLWDPEYYDIVENFFRSMPAQESKKLVLKNVMRSGNLATSHIDELVLQDVVGDLELYPILAHLKSISLVDLNFGAPNKNFMAALADSHINGLTLSNVAPVELFYRLFLAEKTKKEPKKLKNLTSLTIERQIMPKILPANLTNLCLRQIKNSFHASIPKLPPTLTRLDLSQNNLSGLRHVAAAIQQCTQLNILILDGNNFHARELAQLFEMTHLRQLKNISAVGVQPPQHKDISLLLNALKKNTALVELDLSPAILDTRLRNRLQVNCLLAEPEAVKMQLQVTENSDGVTFNVDSHSRLKDVADFFARPFTN